MTQRRSESVIPPALEALNTADEVLFLCSGNIMRSAFAELYARHGTQLAVPVRSGATLYENRHLHPAAERALQERGLPARTWKGFSPTPLRLLAPPKEHTVVFGMTAQHLLAFPQHPHNFLLSRLLGNQDEVPDPIDMADPRPVFSTIQRCVDALARLRS